MATTEFRLRGSPQRVLVVEDDRRAALSLRPILAADGHVVEIAPHAERAVLMLQASQYDLVLTDFQLPNMDGLELAALIKQCFPDLPVVLITAFAEKIGATMGKVSNVDFVVSKPFSVAELHQVMQNVFAVS